ncbi:MAG: aminotransferase class V-fold PLP-dependent enzyme [Legionellales bacterium]|nr:aminotransferase class V-fold PLP-dependent enzyme [Legionellales bacterium]
MDDRPIYLDHMATTPCDPLVIEAMMPYLGPMGDFGNPASATHDYGRRAAIAVENARVEVANSIGARVDDIVFTSGATEANNLAILGAARFYQRKGKHVVTMKTEHVSVLDGFRQLEREGFQVTYLESQADGLLDLSLLEKALREDTILISIMFVNNEIGVIQEIAAIGELLRGRGIVFHVDAAQAAGKLLIDLQQVSVDLMSFSAHKNYGPKGIGALYVRQQPRIRLQTLSFGGGHEGGLRSGTLPTHQIVGMGRAFSLSESMRVQEQARLHRLRLKLWEGIQALPGIHLNGHPTRRIAGHLNVSFSGIDGAALIPALNRLAVSTTSACSSLNKHPSHVLAALGLSADLARSTIRLSVGRFTTEEQVDEVVEILGRQIPRLQDNVRFDARIGS